MRKGRSSYKVAYFNIFVNVAKALPTTHLVLLHQIIRILVEVDAESFYDALPASVDVILQGIEQRT